MPLRLLILASFFWAGSAAALDRAGAIEAARRQVKDRCNSETPCKFTANLEENQWHVRVDFPKRAPGDKPLSHPGGHAIFIFNQNGKVVGRIEGK